MFNFKQFLFWLWLPHLAWGFPYSELYIFGDSMSDTGRLFMATAGKVYPPPYYQGRYSNGPMWGEYLTATLLFGAPYAAETNFAWAAATTGSDNRAGDFPGVHDQITEYIQATPEGADSEALYILWSGHVDLLSQQNQDTITTAIANIGTALDKLQQHGAQHILVPNVFDLGQLPRGRTSTHPASLTALSREFNQQLAQLLQSSQVIQVDLFAFLTALVAENDGRYFTNVTEACLNPDTFTACSQPQTYLFWDDIHLSTRGHQLIAALFHSAVAPPVHLEAINYPEGNSQVWIPAIEVVNPATLNNMLILGATLQRLKQADYRFAAVDKRLYLSQPFETFVTQAAQVARPALYDSAAQQLYVPFIYRIEALSAQLQLVASAHLSLISATMNDPWRVPVFLLTDAVILEAY
ncbi:MAG: SGNH/GDSL hydrolase family protein [Pseudomonadota bacterium]|nr:SGNH/GDSL hydrolase family protein [Pseudomonadota bacterium]